MNNLTNMEPEDYSCKISYTPDPLLEEVETFTVENHPKAHMLSGKLQGRALSFISKMVQPRFILEIGTFTGYSALCLAEGLNETGELHTIEIREEEAAKASLFFMKSKWKNHIFVHNGEAKIILNTLSRPWDLVFVDGDKTGYESYFDLLLPQLSEKGIMVFDNTLFHGKVLQEKISGKNAVAIDNFNKKIATCEGIDKVMLPLRDGILLIRKK